MSWRSAVRGFIPYAVVAASGFLIAYVVVYLFVFPTRLVPDDRAVPDVRGQIEADAEETLRGAGFTPAHGGSRVNASVPAGTVLDQTPVPATQKPAGATVTLTVAAEP